MSIKNFVLVFVLALFFISCNKDDEEIIPDSRVYISITLDDYSVFKNGIGEYLVCPADLRDKDRSGASYGYGGIILFHTMDMERTYVAYDRTCTNEVKSSVKINVNKEGRGVCPQCGSVFNLLSGYGEVISGPAKYPLRSYTSHIYNSPVYGDELQVTN